MNSLLYVTLFNINIYIDRDREAPKDRKKWLPVLRKLRLLSACTLRRRKIVNKNIQH